jgi:threonyl-tRNA synthetase
MDKEKAILLKINGELKETGASTAPGDIVREIYRGDPEALEIYRHSCAHLLAQAVVELFPGVQYGVGPAVENGFYYDFLMPQPFVESDLEKIAAKMAHLVKQNLPIQNRCGPKSRPRTISDRALSI